MKKQRRKFNVPLRYDPSVFNERRGRRMVRRIMLNRRKVKKGKIKPAYAKGKVFPPRNPIDIPE